jgi:hypothetical protein
MLTYIFLLAITVFRIKIRRNLRQDQDDASSIRCSVPFGVTGACPARKLTIPSQLPLSSPLKIEGRWYTLLAGGSTLDPIKVLTALTTARHLDVATSEEIPTPQTLPAPDLDGESVERCIST